MALRDIISIDEELCDGCELCIPACPEGALKIVDGKAKLVSEVYCDGMGSCLGECPQGAITIEQRDADAYDEEAVQQHLTKEKAASAAGAYEPDSDFCGCPSSRVQEIARSAPPETEDGTQAPQSSALRNWPVELMLAPPRADYFSNAKLLISADCVPFAYASFHSDMLAGCMLLVGCPKLDDAQHYQQKLTHILAHNEIVSVDVAFMEVPCCIGLVALVKQALAASGKDIPARALRVGIDGGEPQEIPLDELPF